MIINSQNNNEKIKIISDELTSKIRVLFENKLKKIIIFGSYAKGQQDDESDIDIMAIIDEDKYELQKSSNEIVEISVNMGMEYDILFSIILQSQNEFQKYEDDLPFFRNIKNEGIVVYEQ